jgi:hypothetical protein
MPFCVQILKGSSAVRIFATVGADTWLPKETDSSKLEN